MVRLATVAKPIVTPKRRLPPRTSPMIMESNPMGTALEAPMATCRITTPATRLGATSLVAKPRMTTARLCAPAFPPTRATIGIRAARMGPTLSITPDCRSITSATNKAITKFTTIQGRRIITERRMGVNTVSSGPAPMAAAKSSVASACTASTTASWVTIPISTPA